jgi:hypothetical protein
MYQLIAFKSKAEVTFYVLVAGKTYSAVSLVITLCNLVVINALEEHPAYILTSTMKIMAVSSFQMVAPTNQITQHHNPENEVKMRCCR